MDDRVLKDTHVTLPTILLIEEHSESRQGLKLFLEDQQFRVIAIDLCAATAARKNSAIAAVVIGPGMIFGRPLQPLMDDVRNAIPGIPVVVVTQTSSEDFAIAALRSRVDGYVKYPSSPEDLTRELRRCIGRLQHISSSVKPEPGQMIGNSRAMVQVREYLTRVAPTDSNVLVTGETGTGKELAAEFVHKASHRKNGPFIVVNCAAIPDTLLESELFGYERGAFTGAQKTKDGKLAVANGGTVFLDEIGDMTAYAQVKILRAIDQKEIQRLGDSETIPVDIRIVAATNQDLEALVREGKFRKDLFFRLNVGRVHLPALRDRREDIPLLATHYLHSLCTRFGTAVPRISEETWLHLLGYHWPGNVRELKNILEIVSVHASSDEICTADLPEYVRQQNAPDNVFADERKRLVSALTSTDWNKSKAAEKLQWSRMTLYRKMAKYQVCKAAVGE
jgi:DNA-binding NtrC family response regulator